MGITFDSGLRFAIIMSFQKAPDELISVATSNGAIFCPKKCCLNVFWPLFYFCMIFFIFSCAFITARVVVCGWFPYLKLTLSTFSWLFNTINKSLLWFGGYLVFQSLKYLEFNSLTHHF